jgi:hypothetical protein
MIIPFTDAVAEVVLDMIKDSRTSEERLELKSV